MLSLSRRILSGSGRRAASSFLKALDSAIAENPYREAVRYVKKNDKWTAGKMNDIAEEHANGLYDIDVRPGDRFAVWFDDSVEKHVVTLALAKLGCVVVDFGMNQIQSVDDLRQALKLANCNGIYFEPIRGSLDKLNHLRKAIPEFFYYDDTRGQVFHSKYYPKLKYFIQSGFDAEMGCLTLRDILLPNKSYTSEIVAPTLQDSTPMYHKITRGESGIKMSEVVTHGNVISSKAIPFVNNFVDKVYFEV